MPIQLTTPLNPGAMDPGTLYDHCRIARQTHDDNRLMIILNLDYGTLDGENWVPGQLQPSSDSEYPSSVIIDGEAYTTMITTHQSLDGELTYAAVKRGLYEYLQTNYPALAGSLL